MAKNSIHCRLVTPSESLLDAEVVYASIPAWDGLFGVQANHAPLLARLGLGELRLDFPEGEDGSRSYLVDEGFVQIVDNTLTILAEKAIPAERLTVQEAEAALREAEARTLPDDAPDRAASLQKISRERRRAELALRIAKSHRGKGI
ncbi:MAG: F0F1 ATP synthase subunit epsilon [Phycisphaerales bacterium]|nr:F0F1 ATP synthase subunit epsilon [Phycisphaerales bacterium]